MPPLFNNKDFKVIEYGQHANDDISIDAVKDFFGKILKFKTAQ